MNTVENLTAPSTNEERSAVALEKQAAAAQAVADALETGHPFPERTAKRRFEDVVCACVQARVSATNPPSVEGFLAFARELCDGMDREYPAAPRAPV